ncbi:hypothetical protein BGX28_002260 [Mortierella sp. GBA30]|nr:hypothetical protein BGX28_002260 [Mortierella sp. GBA30]
MYDPNLRSVVLGTNKDEGSSLFGFVFGECTLVTWTDIVARMAPAPEPVTLFEVEYGIPETDVDVARIASQVVGDMIFLYPTQVLTDMFLRLQQERGRVKFKFARYCFDAEMQTINEKIPGLGAMRMGETSFFLDHRCSRGCSQSKRGME